MFEITAQESKILIPVGVRRSKTLLLKLLFAQAAYLPALLTPLPPPPTTKKQQTLKFQLPKLF